MEICTGNFVQDLLALLLGLFFTFAAGMGFEKHLWQIGKRRKEMEELLRRWKEMGI